MNDLERLFRENTGHQIHKWHHYFEIYHRHFARFRGQPVHMLEIGVSQGGSLQLWKSYFGEQARITGVDINPACRVFADERTQILIGDQEDPDFLRQVAESMPRIDILLDDGGHTMGQLRATFDALYPRIDEHGVYMAEDLHSCYWPEYQGGFREPASFIEFSKGLIDQLHAWHSKEPKRLQVDAFTRSAHSMHFYDSILVIEKRPMAAPEHSMTGTPTLAAFTEPGLVKPGLKHKIRKLLR